MTKTRITGVIDEIMRMKSSPSGNPRYVVTINGEHYRTIPDSDFAYEVPNLVGKHVELFLRKLHGREQIMYGGEVPQPERVAEEFMAASGSSQVEEHAFLLGFYQWIAMKPELRTPPSPQSREGIAYASGIAMAQAVHNHLTGQEEE